MNVGEQITQNPDFTARSKKWFGQRYDFASGGVYFPHQPIYGFSRFDEHIKNYWRSYHILRTMEELEFESFLDVGCAEGYFANLTRELFGVRSTGTDFATSGVSRMRQLYGILGPASDAHRLPFDDRSFDLVLCSETLEHVAEPAQVIRELNRVCNKYLIITTPAARDPRALEEHFRHVDPNLIFDHFHFFTEDQLRGWLPEGTVIEGCCHRRLEPWFDRMSDGHDQAAAIRDLLRFIQESCPGLSGETIDFYEQHMAKLVGEQRSRWRWLSRPSTLACLLRFDRWLSHRWPQQTLVFLTLTACHGTPLVRRRRPVPRLLRFLLVENRVDPLRLSQTR